MGAAAEAPTTSHPQESGSQLVIGGSKSNNKHIPVVCLCFDTMVFTQHLRGMAACCGLWLEAMVVDRAWLHTGTHTAALLTLWVRGRLGVYLAGTILSHESAAHLQKATGIFWLAFSYHLLMSLRLIMYLSVYKSVLIKLKSKRQDTERSADTDSGLPVHPNKS